MSERKTAQVELLARDALTRVRRPYGEDIILDVFLVIEKDSALLARYRELEAELTKQVVNQWVGVYTRELTGMDTTNTAGTGRAELIKSYTKLRHRN